MPDDDIKRKPSVTEVRLIYGLLILICLSHIAVAQDRGLVAWWKFDEGSGNFAFDSASQRRDEVLNNFKWVRGVSGGALQFDGFTTVVVRGSEGVPHLNGHFTIEAWIAIQSYPWNWVAIIDQEKDHHSGYYFGIDSEGRLGLQLEVWGTWEECTTQVRLPRMQWVHVASAYDEASGIKLYVNGKLAGRLPVIGRMTPANDVGLRIGRNFVNLPPTGLVRSFVSFPALYSLDGALDDLKIYDRTLTPEEIHRAYQAGNLHAAAPLTPRHWPVIPPGPDQFGAVYTKLKLYPQWDALWRSGPYSDVVVRFKDLSFHYVFWRGTNFEENLVTGNGIWMGDQSFESGTHAGSAEHMSDKKCFHQYISILESTDARVVLHWRYGLVDVLGNFSHVDPLSGWGDWADEYFTIYPDGVAVRYGTVHGTGKHYSFTEPTLLLPPGTKAENFISLDAVTVANMEGESYTYDWSKGLPPFPFPKPANANIAVVNLKSTYKPFYIYVPGTLIGPYGWPPELRLEYSHFPTWNHWPVNQAPSDGRFALFPDRYASAAIMSPDPDKVWIQGPGPTLSTYFLFGLTKLSMNKLAMLARSWLSPPKLKLFGRGFTSEGYATSQRAYLLHRDESERHSALNFELEASRESPVVDPAFVIKGWGENGAVLRINGRAIPKGGNYSWGHVHTLEGADLVVWIRQETTLPERISIFPANHGRIHE
ncbi:MAG TPA: LamG domain-containing protein [Terriglobia bacterium]|nr:LamG domain-containing protein [Terriglobia bacterium]